MAETHPLVEEVITEVAGCLREDAQDGWAFGPRLSFLEQRLRSIDDPLLLKAVVKRLTEFGYFLLEAQQAPKASRSLMTTIEQIIARLPAPSSGRVF